MKPVTEMTIAQLRAEVMRRRDDEQANKLVHDAVRLAILKALVDPEYAARFAEAEEVWADIGQFEVKPGNNPLLVTWNVGGRDEQFVQAVEITVDDIVKRLVWILLSNALQTGYALKEGEEA